jgi:Asp-tRNA(Asn)/Glu-tRNA(Gln) amidotransferase A subunit family amidase
MGMTNASLLLGHSFTAVGYVQAQKIRSWALAHFHQLYRTQFDIIITPTCAQLPPRWYLPGVDMNNGISDAEAIFAAMVFVFLSNFIGNPAISVPNGYDAKSGLPTALQVMANFGCEEDCIAVAALIESKTEKQRPKTFFDIL